MTDPWKQQNRIPCVALLLSPPHSSTMLSRMPAGLRPTIFRPLASTSTLPLPHRSYSQKSWDELDHPPHPSQGNSYSTAYQTRYERERAPLKSRFKKQVPSGPGPPPSEAELARRAVKRIERAERLERKDLTAQLTPTKTCTFTLSLTHSLGRVRDL